jgi:hypothetical protein
MPGDKRDLDNLRSAVVGDAPRREVLNPSSVNSDAKFDRTPRIKRGGKKIVLRNEDDLSDFIEVDYNPTELPFSKVINWNDKTVIGGEDALEFKSIGRREFTWSFFLTDFGYHRKKAAKETVIEKLNWLEDRSGVNTRVVDGEPVDIPYILFLEKGNDVIRVVILKIEGKETFLNEEFDPIRAIVNVTFRRVRLSPNQFGKVRIGRIRRRMF